MCFSGNTYLIIWYDRKHDGHNYVKYYFNELRAIFTWSCIDHKLLLSEQNENQSWIIQGFSDTYSLNGEINSTLKWGLTTMYAAKFRYCHDKGIVSYSAAPVNFLPNTQKIHSKAHHSGRGMGCIWWIQTLIYTLPQWLRWSMQHPVILGRIKTLYL